MGNENPEEHLEGGEPDYKALWEKEKANSRKWEKQAKSNKDAAERLAKVEEDGTSVEEQISDLTKRLDEKEKAEDRAKIAAKVAKDKGVPADLLVGDDEESMAAYADRMLEHFSPDPAPPVDKPGSFDHGDDKGDSEMRDYARQLMSNT